MIMQKCGPPKVGLQVEGPLHQTCFTENPLKTGSRIMGFLAASLLTPGPVTLAPGENSTDNYKDFSELMTKPETIIESPGAIVWESNFGRLSNSQSVPNLPSSNCFRYEANFNPPTELSSLDPISLPQPQSSESNKPDPGKFYEEIIRDSMSGSSFGDSQNPEVRRLHGKALMLAASALASSTKVNYSKA